MLQELLGPAQVKVRAALAATEAKAALVESMIILDTAEMADGAGPEERLGLPRRSPQ